MRLVRQWCFLEARAYEYTLDVSDPVEGQCLSASAYQDFNDAFAKMESGAALSGIPQQRRQLISLRSVLGITGPITDPVTGQVLDEGQQFQQLLALPKNRDADGNVRLTFRTSIDPGNPLFSTQVAEDTIQAVEATFVGSQLAGQPGYLTLTQSGNGRLRGQDGSLTSYALGAQTALVETGVNDDLEHDTTLPQNTDLFGRPVDDPGWTLLIDQTDDPSNAQIDVSKLEDIELLILHGAMTIQPQ